MQATLGEADKEFQAIMNLVTEVQGIAQKYQIPGGLDNAYTTLTAQVTFIIIIIAFPGIYPFLLLLIKAVIFKQIVGNGQCFYGFFLVYPW